MERTEHSEEMQPADRGARAADLRRFDRIIMGIDPGTNVMGYGIITVRGKRAGLVAMVVIDMRKERDPYLRLGKIFNRVAGTLDE